MERRPDKIAAVRYLEKVGCQPDIIAVVRHPHKVERWSDPDVRYPEKAERRSDPDVRCPGGMSENSLSGWNERCHVSQGRGSHATIFREDPIEMRIPASFGEEKKIESWRKTCLNTFFGFQKYFLKMGHFTKQENIFFFLFVFYIKNLKINLLCNKRKSLFFFSFLLSSNQT